LKDGLDEFGKILIENGYNEQIRSIALLREKIDVHESEANYSKFLKDLSDDDYKIFLDFVASLFTTNLFAILSLFETDDQFKLMYEDSSGLVNLKFLHDFLPSEISCDGGWIEKFGNTEIEKIDEKLI